MPNESGGQKCIKHHEQLVHVQLLRELKIGGGKKCVLQIKNTRYELSVKYDYGARSCISN